MIILLHSSKTMRSAPAKGTEQAVLDQPSLLAKAEELDTYLKKLSPSRIAKIMRISPSLATKTHQLIAEWSIRPGLQSAAIDSFLGDIYSGLQVPEFSSRDRAYANEHLFIISGLYGILRALDGICPYRLEMGYRLPNKLYRDLYKYWGCAIADLLPKYQPIVNLASAEYSRAVLPHIDPVRIITPRFLTSKGSGEPSFVVVHAKIARGAFAHWMIRERVSSPNALQGFDLIGYRYDAKLSTSTQPVYVCKEFGGIGLSLRLT